MSPSARRDGRTHAKPVWAVWLDEALAFSTHPETVTARNLRTNPEVAVHLEVGEQVLILEGRARRTHDRPFLASFGRVYEAKYEWPMGPEAVDPENPDAAFYRVRPRTALSWAASTEIGETITRWSFEEIDP